MSLITGERFIAIKTKVKNECLRRCYTGSVAEYGGSSYDYKAVPGSNKYANIEHYEKLAVPLNAINKNDIPSTSGHRIISNGDLTLLDTKVTLYQQRDIYDNTGTDCSSSCTGACFSCTGSCGGSCTNTCTNTCTDTCSTTCSGCTGGCTGCRGYCGCGWSCSTSCSTSCDVHACIGCGDGTDSGFCSCGGGCSTGCTGCSGCSASSS